MKKTSVTLTKKEWTAIMALIQIGIDEASQQYDEKEGKKILAKIEKQLE